MNKAGALRRPCTIMLGVRSIDNLSMNISRALSWFYKVWYTSFLSLLSDPFPSQVSKRSIRLSTILLAAIPCSSAFPTLPSSPIRLLLVEGLLLPSRVTSCVMQLSHTGDGPRSIDLVP